MKTLVLLLLFFSSSFYASAQTDSTRRDTTTTTVSQQDSTKNASVVSDSTSSDSTDAPLGISIGRRSFRMNASAGFELKEPTLDFSFGRSGFSAKGLRTSIQPMNVIEFSIGSFILKRLKRTNLIARTEFDRPYVQVYNNDFGPERDTLRPHLQGWRIGYHIVSGYSYIRSDRSPSLSLLHTGGPVWSSNTFKNLPSRGPDTVDAPSYKDLSRYYFGSHTGFMLRYDINSVFSVHADAERTMMFNNYSFFGWIGSILVEGIAQGLLTGNVIQAIEQKSPSSAPVANIVLRTALSVILYELRRSHQHFPFGGNEPMVMDAIRIGLSISF